jgi:hypothetical protein
MKTAVLIQAWMAVAILSGRPHPDAKGDVEQALQKLAAAENFSWVAMTIEETDGKDPKLADSVEGKSIKGGWSRLSRPKTKKSTDAFLKGERLALLTTQGWKAVDVKEVAPGAAKPAKDIRPAQDLLHAKSPLMEAKVLLGRLTELERRENGLYSGRVAPLNVPILLEHAAAAGHKIPGYDEPQMRVNFRIVEGLLGSYELVVSGRNTKAKKGQIVQSLVSMAVDFTDVGTTTLEIPDEARKLLE